MPSKVDRIAGLKDPERRARTASAACMDLETEASALREIRDGAVAELLEGGMSVAEAAGIIGITRSALSQRFAPDGERKVPVGA